MFMKISICLFLLRIVDHKGARRFMHGLIAVLVITTAVFVFLFFGICRPLSAYWTVGTEGDCLGSHREMQIMIAQGGKEITPLELEIHDLTAISHFYSLGPCSGGEPGLVPSTRSDQSPSENLPMRVDGHGCNV